MSRELELFWQMRRIDAMLRRGSRNSKNDSEPQEQSPHARGHGKILHMLESVDSITQRELAERLNIRPQSLTLALARLEEQGAIVRVRSDTDRRQVRVSLTEEGRARGQSQRERMDNQAQLAAASLSPDELDELARLLSKIEDELKQLED